MRFEVPVGALLIAAVAIYTRDLCLTMLMCFVVGGLTCGVLVSRGRSKP